MQQLHGIAQEDFSIKVFCPVRREQVMQIQSKWRITESFTATAAGGQAYIAPAGIGSDLMEEEIELISLGSAWRKNPVRGQRGHIDIATDGPGDVVIDQAVIQQVFQYRGHGGDGECAAHRCPLPRCCKYSAKDTEELDRVGAGREAGGAGGVTALTSIRPIVTRM